MTASKLLVKREGDFHYPICFEEDFSNLAQVMKEEGLVDRKICIVTDSNVGPLYEESVKQVLSEVSSDISVFTFEAGEKNKNLNTVSALYQALIQNGLDRKSLLVALGGGVVGDLTGFGAATYLRGIDFIQVPTTLLAQVDSSVGRKNRRRFSAVQKHGRSFSPATSCIYESKHSFFASGRTVCLRNG